MRVLVVTNLYPNPFDPNRGTFNRQQLRAVADRHPVRVISPVAWIDELAARRRGVPRLPAGRRRDCDGIPVEHPRYLYTPKVLRGSYGRFYRRSIRAAFARALAEFRPDVVYSPWAYPDGWAAIALGRTAGLPVVVKVHGSDVLGDIRHQAARLRRTAEALRGADAVVAVSRDLARNVVDLGAEPGRVRVVYDGIDARLFRPGSRPEARARLGLDGTDPLLLFVGRLVPVKGLDVLLDACAELARSELRFRLCLVGDGPLRGSLEQRAARLGLAGTVQFCGPRPHGQLPDWFRAADLFVLPSRSEGLPSVLLEATACGTPFVASRVGGIPEITGPAGSRLAPPEDAGRLATAMGDFLREGGGPACDPGAARTWAQSAVDLVGVLEEALRGCPAAPVLAG
jgi:glycosyltransferase involved in cell wall biosynthesis